MASRHFSGLATSVFGHDRLAHMANAARAHFQFDHVGYFAQSFPGSKVTTAELFEDNTAGLKGELAEAVAKRRDLLASGNGASDNKAELQRLNNIIADLEDELEDLDGDGSGADDMRVAVHRGIAAFAVLPVPREVTAAKFRAGYTSGEGLFYATWSICVAPARLAAVAETLFECGSREIDKLGLPFKEGFAAGADAAAVAVQKAAKAGQPAPAHVWGNVTWGCKPELGLGGPETYGGSEEEYLAARPRLLQYLAVEWLPDSEAPGAGAGAASAGAGADAGKKA